MSLPRPNEFRSATLSFEKLEPRRVLDASFTATADQLVLNDFDGEVLTLSENDAAYQFGLSEGIWKGEPTFGITGEGTSVLSVDRALLNALDDGLLATNDGEPVQFDVVFNSIDFSGMAGEVALLSNSTSQTPGSLVVVPAVEFGGNVQLEQTGNDFDTISILGDGPHSIFDTDEIVLKTIESRGELGVKAAGDISTELGSRIRLTGLPAGPVGKLNFESGGNINLAESQQLAFKQLQFQSEGETVLRNTSTSDSSSSIHLVGVNSSAGLTLTSSAGIFDISDSTMINGHTTIAGGGNITLGIGAGVKPRFFVKRSISVMSPEDIYMRGEFGRINFQADGLVDIFEFGTMRLVGNNRAGRMLLEATYVISDVHGATLAIDGTTILTAPIIYLGDHPANQLSVGGDLFVNGSDYVYFGEQGTFDFERIKLTAPGYSDISHDGSIYFISRNRFGAANIQTAGLIRDQFDAKIHVTGNLTLNSTGIYIADQPGNELIVDGLATFVSRETSYSSESLGNIVVGMESILFGYASDVRLGQLRFVAPDGYVTINESDGMYLIGTNSAEQLVLRTNGNLLNAPGVQLNVHSIDYDNDDSEVPPVSSTAFMSSKGIFLGLNANDQFDLCGTIYFVTDGFAVMGEPGEWRSLQVLTNVPNFQINIDYYEC